MILPRLINHVLLGYFVMSFIVWAISFQIKKIRFLLRNDSMPKPTHGAGFRATGWAMRCGDRANKRLEFVRTNNQMSKTFNNDRQSYC